VTATRYEIGYSTWNARLLGLLGLGPRHSSLVVSDDAVTVTMGWGFSVAIPRESIVSIETDDERVWGWGVHGWRGRWLVNGTSRGLVRFTIEPPARARTAFFHLDLRVLRVSLADRDALLAAML
jgi:hypothetical protein